MSRKSKTAILIHLGDSSIKLSYSTSASNGPILCHVDMNSWCPTMVGYSGSGTLHGGSAEGLLRLSPESVVPSLLSLATVKEPKDLVDFCSTKNRHLHVESNSIKVKLCNTTESKVVKPLDILCALFEHASKSAVLHYYRKNTTFRDHTFECVVVISGECTQEQFDLVQVAISKTEGLKLKTILPESVSACFCFWRKDTSLYVRIGLSKTDIAVVKFIRGVKNAPDDYRVKAHVTLNQFGLVAIADFFYKDLRPQANIVNISANVKTGMVDSLCRLANENLTLVTDDVGSGHLVSAAQLEMCLKSYRASIYSAVSKAIDLAGVDEENLKSVVSSGRLGASSAVVGLLNSFYPDAVIYTRPANNNQVELKGAHEYLHESSIDFQPTTKHSFNFKADNLSALALSDIDDNRRTEAMKRLEAINRNHRGVKKSQRS